MIYYKSLFVLVYPYIFIPIYALHPTNIVLTVYHCIYKPSQNRVSGTISVPLPKISWLDVPINTS